MTIRESITPLRETALLEAASRCLESDVPTWPALWNSCVSTAPADLVFHLSRDLLEEFRDVFSSDYPWPPGDRETRCLAFLFLNEILKEPTK